MSRTWSRAWHSWVQPVTLGFGGAAIIASKSGVTLNLLLGGAAYATVMTPMLVQHYRDLRWRAAGLFTLSIAIVWLLAVVDRQVSVDQWLSVCSVLASVVSVEVGLEELLETIGLAAEAAGMLVLLAGIAWATWPVWGSLHLPDSGAPHVVPLHPLFAINGVVPDLGTWTEQSTPYKLTAFGQNVVYRLPVTVLPCVALHVALAGLCWGASHALSKRKTFDNRGLL